MAPTNTKTWSLSKNNSVTGDVTRTGGSGDLTNGWKQLWIDIKDQLKTFGWVVEGSSDGTTGAMDSVDRWSTISDLLAVDISGGPSAHSWIVMRQPGTSKHVLFSNAHQSSDTLPAKRMILSVAVTVYTGGSNTTDPTSVDEGSLKTGTGFLTNNWIEPDGGDKDMTWHMWHSTDGKNTRVAIYTSSILRSFWMFEELESPQTNWSPAWIDGILSGGASSEPANHLNHYWEFTENFIRSYHVGIPPLRAIFSTMCVDFNDNSATNSLYALVIPASLDGIRVFPYEIWTDDFSKSSRLGEIADLWPEGIQADGSGYPSTPGPHVHVGDHWVLPWDSTAYNIS